MKSHNVEGVKAVDYGGAHCRGAEDAGAVAPLRDWPELVLAPGVAHVVVPAVLHHLQQREKKEKKDQYMWFADQSCIVYYRERRVE